MSEPNTTEFLKSVKSLYLKEDFEGAIDTLLKNKDLLDKGLFHYNLGTLYLKKEYWGAGRYHLEKALKAGFVNEMEYKNLLVAKSRPGIVDLSRSESWTDRSLDTALSIPDTGYLIASMVLAVIILFLARRKIIRSWSGVMASLVIVSLPGIFYFHFLSGLKEAVVLKNSPVYEGPSQIYRENIVLQEGSKIIIGRRSGNWFFVRYPKGIGGWVNRKNLGLF